MEWLGCGRSSRGRQSRGGGSTESDETVELMASSMEEDVIGDLDRGGHRRSEDAAKMEEQLKSDLDEGGGVMTL